MAPLAPVLRAHPEPHTTQDRREAAFWRIIARLGEEIAELEAELHSYRELAQLALAQQHALIAENTRLRRSREAEAAIVGAYPR